MKIPRTAVGLTVAIGIGQFVPALLPGRNNAHERGAISPTFCLNYLGSTATTPHAVAESADIDPYNKIGIMGTEPGNFLRILLSQTQNMIARQEDVDPFNQNNP